MESRMAWWKQSNPDGSYEDWRAYEKGYMDLITGMVILRLNELVPRD
jgi:hypothetical protein